MATKKPKPSEKTRRMLYFPKDLDRRLRMYAAERGRPISTIVTDAVATYLKAKRR